MFLRSPVRKRVPFTLEWSAATHSTVKVFSLLCLALPFPGSAASISLIDGQYEGEKYIGVTGTIVEGDLQRLKSIAPRAINSGNNTLTLLLNSPGGDVEEGIRIGRWARTLMASTYVYGSHLITVGTEHGEYLRDLGRQYQQLGFRQVPKSPGERLVDSDLTKCHSACVLVFFGGVDRHVSDNIDSRYGRKQQKTYPVIGLHRPYYEKARFAALNPAEAQVQYANLEREVKLYLEEMGAPTELINRMFRRASNDIDLVPDSEFSKMYQAREPFLDEWLIARCGPFGPNAALNQEEARDWHERSELLKKAVAAGRVKSREDFHSFSTPRLSAARAAALEQKSFEYNGVSKRCRDRSIHEHQQAHIQKR